MSTTTPTAFDGANHRLAEDQELLEGLVGAVGRTAQVLAGSLDGQSRPGSFAEIKRLLHENDELGGRTLRKELAALRPGVGWAEEDDGPGVLPEGEWWVADPCEGNINKVHGIPEFCASATLVRNNRPVIAAMYLPFPGLTYAAVAGGGATENGRQLQVSRKTSLDGAYLTSCQNGPHEGRATATRLGAAVTALLVRNAILRIVPPPTLQLLHVASGRVDGFFLFVAERAGLAGGLLMAAEAGALITDLRGRPWSLASEDVLVAAPGLRSELLQTLLASPDATTDRSYSIPIEVTL